MNLPTTGGVNVPVRLLAQYSDHCARSGSYSLTVRPEKPFVGKSISSKDAAPPKCRLARVMPGNSSHSLVSSRKSVRHRLRTFQVPGEKAKCFIPAPEGYFIDCLLR